MTVSGVTAADDYAVSAALESTENEHRVYTARAGHADNLNVCGIVETVVARKVTYIPEFLVFRFPLGKTDGKVYREEKRLCINGVTLPVGITECTETVREKTKVKLSKEVLQLQKR